MWRTTCNGYTCPANGHAYAGTADSYANTGKFESATTLTGTIGNRWICGDVASLSLNEKECKVERPVKLF